MGDGSKILIRCPTQLDSTAYQSVLEESLQDMYVDDSVFMQDGTPCHTSRSWKEKNIFLGTGHHSHLTSKTCGPFWRHVYSISKSSHPMIYGMIPSRHGTIFQ